MNPRPFLDVCFLAKWLLAVAAMLAWVPSTSAGAVDFIEIIEKETAQQSGNQHGFRIEHFDQWVFRDQKKLADAQRQLAERLQGEVAMVHATLKMTDQQKEKLLLAGQGDLQGFLQLYSEVRGKFSEALKQNDQQKVQNLWQEIQPLQKKYNGQIYGAGSIFDKTLVHLLDEQQSARLEQIRREQRKFQYQAAVNQWVLQFEQAAPLTHGNRQKLLAMIDQYTYPPKSMTSSNGSHLLRYYILAQMADFPEGELRTLFDEPVWKVLQVQLRQGKSMQRSLEKQGLVPDKD
jgi:hypothetical protein